MTEFQHKDKDGDVIRVWGGEQGAVIYSADHNIDSISTMVAVHFDKLPDLIATLSAILATDIEATP
jgi:hypothetical protein